MTHVEMESPRPQQPGALSRAQTSGERAPRPRSRVRELAPLVLTYGLFGVLVWAMFSGYFTSEGIGIMALVLMLGLVMAGVQVAAAMILSSFLGMWAAQGWFAASNLVHDLPFDAVAQWSLTVLPMFIFLGLLLWQSGVTTKLYEAGRDWLRWLPGGLAVGTNAAGAGMAAVSGSTIGSTYALARIGMPEMLRAGYDRRLVVAAIMSAGLPGQLIPPSIMMVLYAGIAQVAVGPQLLAGVVPGLIVFGLYSAAIVAFALLRPAGVGRDKSLPMPPAATWGTRFRSLGAVWLVPVIVLIVVGGTFSGVFTATESAAVGALVALVATLWYRRRTGPVAAVRTSVVGSLEGVGAVFLVIIGSYATSDMLAVTGLGNAFTDWVSGLGLSRVAFLLVLFVGYLILGTFIEPLPMMLMTVPLLLPALQEAEISLMWFGVFVVFMGELAILTPPVGILLYVIANLTKEPEVNAGVSISMRDLFVAQLVLLPVALVVVLVLIFFPEAVTALPNLSE